MKRGMYQKEDKASERPMRDEALGEAQRLVGGGGRYSGEGEGGLLLWFAPL